MAFDIPDSLSRIPDYIPDGINKTVPAAAILENEKTLGTRLLLTVSNCFEL